HEITALEETLAGARRTTAEVDERLRGRIADLEVALAGTRRRLATARGALSFRIGRDATLALRKARVDPLAAPAQFLLSLRGDDDDLAEPAPGPDARDAA